MNEFLIDIGFLDRAPAAPLPCKEISSGRSGIQGAKYSGKKDWEEIEKYRKFREDNRLELIPFKHYEQP